MLSFSAAQKKLLNCSPFSHLRIRLKRGSGMGIKCLKLRGICSLYEINYSFFR